MKKIVSLLAILIFCGTAFSQVYVPIFPTIFGQTFNRIKPFQVLHIPEKNGLSANTTDTTAQIFYNKLDSSFWVYSKAKGYFKAGGADVSTGINANALIDPTSSVDLTINSLLLGRGPGNQISNTVFGNDALTANGATSTFNVAMGYQALKSQTNNSVSNVAIGPYAMRDNTSNGSANVVVGYLALPYSSIAGGANGGNVVLGSEAGSFAAGGGNILAASRSIFIGQYATGLGTNQTNQIVIGPDGEGLGSNSTVLGNSGILKTRIWGKLGLGTSNPDLELHVVGGVKIVNGTQGAGKVLTSDASGATTWQTPSVTPYPAAGIPVSNGTSWSATLAKVVTDRTIINDTVSMYTFSDGTFKYDTLRTQFSVTTIGSSGASTYDPVTGILNVPNYAGGGGGASLTADQTFTGINTFDSMARFRQTLGMSGIVFENKLAAGDTVGIRLVPGVGGGSDLAVNAPNGKRLILGTNGYATRLLGIMEFPSGFSTNVSGGSFNADAVGNFQIRTNVANIDIIDGGYNKLTKLNSYTGFPLVINGGGSNDGNGEVRIGSTSLTGGKLNIQGAIKITDGTEGVGKVLTSDVNGLASWGTVPGGVTHVVATDANITANNGYLYHLPAATLSVGRNIDLSALSVDGYSLTILNNEIAFPWTFTGLTVYDTDFTTVITSPLVNSMSKITRVNGKLIITEN